MANYTKYSDFQDGNILYAKGLHYLEDYLAECLNIKTPGKRVSETNFNNITEPGVYAIYQEDMASAVNKPQVSVGGKLIVIANYTDGSITQFLIIRSTNIIYWRTYNTNGGNWSNWHTSGTTNKNLKIGNKTFNGSTEIAIEAADLGLGNAVRFVGVVEAQPKPEDSTDGDIILCGNIEYIFSNGKWVEIGNETLHAFVKQTNTTTDKYRPLTLGTSPFTDTTNFDKEATGQLYVNEKLYVQPSSGTLYATNFQGQTAHFTSPTDATEGNNAKVALRLGDAAGQHIDIDTNEILSKSNASTIGTLFLNDLAVNDSGIITTGTWNATAIGTAYGGTGHNFSNIPTNAIIRNSGDNTGLWYTPTKSGALYATAENGAIKFGILPIAQGGTGANSANAAQYNLLKGMNTNNNPVTENSYIVFKYMSTDDAKEGAIFAKPVSALQEYLLTKDNITAALGYTPPTINTTYSQATPDTLGLVKIGYKQSNKNYPVELNSSGQMYVNVPWDNTNTEYTLPAATDSILGGVKIGNHISVSNGTISLTKANVTAALGYTPPTTNTTYSAATANSDGLMTAAMFTKLDGIAAGANNYSLPMASSSTLGGVKTGSTVTSTSGLTACPIINGIVYYKDTNTQTITSVNNKTGAVSLTYTDVNAAPASHTHNYLPLSGGTLTSGLTGTTAHFTSNTDAAEGSNASVALRLGPASGQHIDIDGNEILSKTNATTVGSLYVQDMQIDDGGVVKKGTWQGTAVDIAYGGTGATDKATALSNLGAVPTTRTINNKPLSSNITLSASDVGATATNKAATLAWNTTTTIATVSGVNITVKLPANPDTNTTYSVVNGVGTTEGIVKLYYSSTAPSTTTPGAIWLKGTGEYA